MSNEGTGAKPLIGEVLEEDDLVSLADLCRSCTVEIQTITTLVAEGILDPAGRDVDHWRFTVGSLKTGERRSFICSVTSVSTSQVRRWRWICWTASQSWNAIRSIRFARYERHGNGATISRV